MLSGCAGPLTVHYKSVSKAKDLSAVSIVVADVADVRDASHRADNPRLIGYIKTTVTDMTGSKLVIDTDVAALVAKALRDELAAAGYTVMGAGDRVKGDFVVSGKVSAFSLDIGPRDEIEITVEAVVTETETGRVIWSGVKTHKTGRYAGVMGNSRETISAYISASLAGVVRGVIDETAPMIENTRAAYRQIEARRLQQAEPEQGTGRLVITSVPNRSKVYLNNVYYGLTPLNIDIEPGVYELRVSSKSYKDAQEKVSVRAGQLTEAEMEMQGIDVK
ncbi:MAG: hypothetical protein A3J24_07660 [Deltaproteobacteria bacterium RIFCSPLOWO2_02_FULL_53_8]|nr:MAG: hypothetical protein A3J24_07660 [Deltaproteobacteria bacterium RIFCSPLOWO2_02_FULL_53_8]